MSRFDGFPLPLSAAPAWEATGLAQPFADGELADRVRVSQRHPGYLEAGDGTSFIPIGLNLSFPRFAETTEKGMACYAEWLHELASNGGNFFRLWLGHSFFDVESDRAGVFEEEGAERLQGVLDLAASLGLRVKVTLEHFRSLEARRVREIFPGAARFERDTYHRSKGGPAESMDEFWQDGEVRRFYLKKLDWLAERFSQHPAIVAWELWNEINAAQGHGWEAWSEFMMPELRARFPGCLILQSLGSFCGDSGVAPYRWLADLPGNDVLQVHRYLDPGAEWAICRGPMDVLLANAVETLRDWREQDGGEPRPILLAEGGAVEAHHAGPSRLYEKDSEGILLHDVLFAAFFAGAAGCGQAWHWDVYVAKHRLWWQFARFGRAVEGFDPIREEATPIFWNTPRLRVYGLRGRQHSLLWLRDGACDGKTELETGQRALPVSNECLSLPASLPRSVCAATMNPWNESGWRTSEVRFVNGSAELVLPTFTRSLVLKLIHTPELSSAIPL